MTERGGRENGRGETEDWEGDNKEGIGERGAVEEEKNGGTRGGLGGRVSVHVTCQGKERD